MKTKSVQNISDKKYSKNLNGKTHKRINIS